MDFSSYVRKKTPELRLQFYTQRPMKTLMLEKFEELAIERLKILRCVEAAGQEFNKHSPSYSDWLVNNLMKGGCLSRAMILHTEDSFVSTSNSAKSDIEDDIYSHFILSLAYCRSESLSNWFMTQETDLFLFRFKIESNHNSQTIERFINQFNIKILLATADEKKSIQVNLTKEITNSLIYKVRFDEVYDLVRKRSCPTIRGYVFLISVSDLSSIIKSRLRVHLSHTLTIMRSNVGIIDQDVRLRPLLATLNTRYTGKSYIVDKDTKKVTAADIPSLIKLSFPPCMDQIHRILINEHHLKHDGRLQYSLFLKGIGLPVEESIKFFADAFQPKTDVESFSKKYAYNIRHGYGLEGKRVDYSPYSCMKIINTNSVNGCGGCPFKTTDINLLTQKIKSHPTATNEQINSIIDKASKSQYQISCREYFKMMHDLPSDYPLTILHPNQYFEESQKILQSKLDILKKF